MRQAGLGAGASVIGRQVQALRLEQRLEQLRMRIATEEQEGMGWGM